MAREFRPGLARRVANALLALAIRTGLPMRDAWLLTTRGRRSGRPHATPVVVQEIEGTRWIVSPYGVRDWVLNVRAEPAVALRHGRRHHRVRLVEVNAATAAPILKRYVDSQPFMHRYFDASHDAPVEAFEREADAHPVFRVEE